MAQDEKRIGDRSPSGAREGPAPAGAPSPRVRDLMNTRNLVTVGPEDDLGLAMQVMLWRGARHLPVVVGRTVVGVVSERDILARRAEVGRREADRLQIRATMSVPPIVVGPDEDAAAAAAKLVANRVDFLPVVDDPQELVGIITSTDIVREQAVRLTERPLPGTVRAADVMTEAPLTVKPFESFLDAVAVMVERNVRHLPVVDESERLVGMLSDRDVRSVVGDPAVALKAPAAGERDLGALQVSAAMSVDPVTVAEDDPLPTVLQRFLDERVGAVAVVDRDQRLVGVISYLDALHVVLEPYRSPLH